MKEITEKDYWNFLKHHEFVVIESVKISLLREYKMSGETYHFPFRLKLKPIRKLEEPIVRAE